MRFWKVDSTLILAILMLPNILRYLGLLILTVSSRRITSRRKKKSSRDYVKLLYHIWFWRKFIFACAFYFSLSLSKVMNVSLTRKYRFKMMCPLISLIRQDIQENAYEWRGLPSHTTLSQTWQTFISDTNIIFITYYYLSWPNSLLIWHNLYIFLESLNQPTSFDQQKVDIASNVKVWSF